MSGPGGGSGVHPGSAEWGGASAQFDETAWWGDCANTWHEEEKQLVYAARMGLRAEWGGAHPPTYDLKRKSIIDLGGGPVSILLKCRQRGRCVIVDPGDFPPWVRARYAHCGIDYWRTPAEKIADDGPHFDEAWIYNVLQHVDDPAAVIAKARAAADVLRIFEWIDVAPYEGHPHLLTEDFLNEAVGGMGYTARLDEHGAVGRAYYGVF